MAIIKPNTGILSLRALQFTAIIAGLATFVLLIYTIQVVIKPQLPPSPRTAAEKALFDAKGEVARNPKNAKARLALARVYIGIGQYEKALASLRSALSLDKNNVEARYLTGVAYYEMGNYGEALSNLQKAASIKGAFAEQLAPIYEEIGKTYSAIGKSVNAVDAYKKALAYQPEAADIIFLLAQEYERLGDKQRAVKAYKGVLSYLPDDEKAAAALKRLQTNSKR